MEYLSTDDGYINLEVVLLNFIEKVRSQKDNYSFVEYLLCFFLKLHSPILRT